MMSVFLVLFCFVLLGQKYLLKILGRTVLCVYLKRRSEKVRSVSVCYGQLRPKCRTVKKGESEKKIERSKRQKTLEVVRFMEWLTQQAHPLCLIH